MRPIVRIKIFKSKPSGLFRTEEPSTWGTNISLSIFILYSKVDLCSCVSRRLHIEPDKKHTAFSSSNLSGFDGRLSIYLMSFSLRSLQSAAIKTMPIWPAIFPQKKQSHQKADVCERLLYLLLETASINVSWNPIFFL